MGCIRILAAAGLTSLTVLGCLGPAAAAKVNRTLIPVQSVEGARSTNVFGINDNNQIVGDYVDSNGIEHGFLGTLDGKYTFFDYPGTALGTEPRSINKKGYVLGFAPDRDPNTGPEFLRSPDGTIDNIVKSGAPLEGVAQGLSQQRLSVGDYLDPNTGEFIGYQARNGKYVQDVMLSVPATRIAPRAINDKGIIAGWFSDSLGEHGFVLQGTDTQVFDADDSGTTMLEGLNDLGIGAGQVTDGDNNSHAFAIDTATNTVNWIDVPGSSSQQAWGINKKGLIAITTDIGSYIYCPYKPTKCPGQGKEVAERMQNVSGSVAASHISRHGIVREQATRQPAR